MKLRPWTARRSRLAGTLERWNRYCPLPQKTITTNPMSKDFDARYNASRAALDAIGLHELDSLLSREQEHFAKFIGAVTKTFGSQLQYDAFTNIPCGILTREEFKGHALRQSIVSATASTFGFDIGDLREFCAAILQDANDHELAALIRNQ